MDLINLFRDLSELSNKSLKDVLLKRITNDYYYVIDFMKGNDKWECQVRKIKGTPEEIVKRIKLFDQPSASKIGASFSIVSFIGKEKILKILEYIESIGVSIDGLRNDIEKGICIYPETEKEAMELWGESIKGLRGYGTVMINGKYVVDEEGYEDKVVRDLYKELHEGIEEGDFCYLCGETDVKKLIHGGIKEPGWKILSITRSTNLPKDRKVFIRCMDCEEKIMKGMDLIKSIIKYESYGNKMFERVIIPLSKDERLWDRLIELRKEYDSDLEYYEEVERLFERFERRGIEDFLNIRVVRNQRSYAVLDAWIVNLEEIRRLRYKDDFDRFCWDHGFYTNGRKISYYPEGLLDSEDDYKWNYVERIKKYWLGLENGDWVREVEKFLKYKEGKLSVYRLWEKYIEKGEEMLWKEIVNSKNYIIGKLLKFGIIAQRRDLKKEDVPLFNKFLWYPKDMEYVRDEVINALKIRKRLIKREEKEIIENLLQRYEEAKEGERFYYFLGLLGVEEQLYAEEVRESRYDEEREEWD